LRHGVGAAFAGALAATNTSGIMEKDRSVQTLLKEKLKARKENKEKTGDLSNVFKNAPERPKRKKKLEPETPPPLEQLFEKAPLRKKEIEPEEASSSPREMNPSFTPST